MTAATRHLRRARLHIIPVMMTRVCMRSEIHLWRERRLHIPVMMRQPGTTRSEMHLRQERLHISVMTRFGMRSERHLRRA